MVNAEYQRVTVWNLDCVQNVNLDIRVNHVALQCDSWLHYFMSWAFSYGFDPNVVKEEFIALIKIFNQILKDIKK